MARGGGVIRVLLVEGDQAERAALARALGEVSGIDVVGPVGDGSVAPSAVMALNPDVVVLAAHLPTIAGPDAAALLAAECPQVRVVGLGDRSETRALSAMRDAGAVGVVARTADPAALAAAILDAVTCA
jgi:DNA-binding NarL/FixJ family response regulator